MKKRKIPNIILWSCFIVTLLVLYISIEAVLETQNWRWFDIDFSGSEKVISGYGALLAAIISTFSIILLVYTIYLQITESREQAKRFRKEYKLQKKQFEEEKRREERKEKLELYYKLKLISVFLESIIGHIEQTAIEIKRFYLVEKEMPLGMNMLYFLVNKSMSKLIEMDYLGIFVAFKEFLEGERDWTKNFNELFDLVGFYNDALEELRSNYKNHSHDKLLRKNEIAEDLKILMDEASNVSERYRMTSFHSNIGPEIYSTIIGEFVSKYYEILEKDDENKIETDFDELSQGLLKDLISQIIDIKSGIGFGPFGVKELVISASSIRKKIQKLKFDSENFAKNVEMRYYDYFAPKSKQLKKLKVLKHYIDKELDKINPDKL